MRILILCTGNSCRSQMAEALLRSFDDRLEVYSAGTFPSNEVHPKANQVMAEIFINIGDYMPKDVKKYIDQSFDYVITVCGNAKETCPVFMGDVKERRHIGFEDPAEAEGTEEEVIKVFREVRDLIKKDFYYFYLNEIKDKL